MSTMKRNNTSIDGFSPRRRATKPITQARNTDQPTGKIGHPDKDIEDSLSALNLSSIDEPDDSRKAKRRRRRADKASNPRRRLIKRIAIAVGVVLLLVAGFFIYRAIRDMGNIFDGGLWGLMRRTPLKMDANGRTNIVIFGTSEDEDGHDGGNLTDSIMLLSVHSETRSANMISIPRDLWIEYDEPCMVGYAGRINAVYFCASNNGQNERAGAEALQSKVGQVTGVETHYFVHMNFTSMISAVDAVGGVSVKIESEDPRGIYDPATGINFRNNEVVRLNGEQALALARARNAYGGYGLPGSNFDRERNQQKIMMALFEEAAGLDLITDMRRIRNLMQAMGGNLRTNINTGEIRSFAYVAQGVNMNDIKSIDLMNDGDDPLLVTGWMGGQSVVNPAAGTLDFTQIQAFLRRKLATDPVTREAASVIVHNSSSVDGLARSMADELESLGMIVSSVGSTQERIRGNVVIYQLNSSKAATRKRLEERYGVQVRPARDLPQSMAGLSADYIIIVSSERALHG